MRLKSVFLRPIMMHRTGDKTELCDRHRAKEKVIKEIRRDSQMKL